MVDFGREFMGRPDQYVVDRGYLLLFPRQKCSYVCSVNANLNIWTDKSTVISMDH